MQCNERGSQWQKDTEIWSTRLSGTFELLEAVTHREIVLRVETTVEMYALVVSAERRRRAEVLAVLVVREAASLVEALRVTRPERQS